MAVLRHRTTTVLLLVGLVASTVVGMVIRRPFSRHALVMLVPFCFFLAVMSRQARRPFLSRTVALGLGAVLLASTMAFPPRESTDVWAYAMYGRIVAVHHANPYVSPPSAYPADPWLERVTPRWRDTKSVYGPLFSGISAVVVRAAGESPARTRAGFQALAALAVFLSLVIIDRRTRDAGAVASIGLNPLVVVGFVNGAHNDVLVGLAVLVAVLLAMRDRPKSAGFALALGALVKASALLPAVALLAWMLHKKGARAAVKAAVTAGVVGSAVLAASGGLTVLSPLAKATDLVRYSIWDLPRRLRFVTGADARTFVPPWWALPVVLAVALIVIARYVRRRTPEAAVGGGSLAYLVAGPYLLPWYTAWSLPLVALRWRSRLSLLTQVQAAALSWGYLTAQSLPHGAVLTFHRGYLIALGLWEIVVLGMLLTRWSDPENGRARAAPARRRFSARAGARARGA